MSTCRAALLLAFVAGGALAGPYDQPYAMVEAADRSEVRKESPPALVRIDGRSPMTPRRSEALTPGRHEITIRYETARSPQSTAKSTRTLELDLKPCTRYRIAARRTQGYEWEPHVYSEPMYDCQRKFKLEK